MEVIMATEKEVLPPCPAGMSEELYEQYVLWFNQPKRFESLYPIIFKEFLKPYIDLESQHEKD